MGESVEVSGGSGFQAASVRPADTMEVECSWLAVGCMFFGWRTKIESDEEIHSLHVDLGLMDSTLE